MHRLCRALWNVELNQFPFRNSKLGVSLANEINQVRSPLVYVVLDPDTIYPTIHQYIYNTTV